MFKLPNCPSAQADIHELADFAEMLCWEQTGTSTREIVAYLGRVNDNENNVGCNDDDDINSDNLDEVMNEIERRATACGSGYPFRLDHGGAVLHHANDSTPRSVLYRYLLLSTRLNMKDSRTHAGIDGCGLLEELAAHALKNYLGGGRARALVFGTAAPGRFKDKVEHLCRELHEGDGFRSLDIAPVEANDDKLDTVAWVPFADLLPGQLVLFGQCKTGTSWGESITQLRPEAFVTKWMKTPILVTPVRAFCISEATDRSRWKGTTVTAGILFDRCRLVDFSDGIDSRLLGKVLRWTNAAKSTVTLVQSTGT